MMAAGMGHLKKGSPEKRGLHTAQSTGQDTAVPKDKGLRYHKTGGVNAVASG